MQIETTMSYQLTPVRMAIIKNRTNNKDCEDVIVCWFLKKLKLEPPYDPATWLLGIYPNKKKKLVVVSGEGGWVLGELSEED